MLRSSLSRTVLNATPRASGVNARPVLARAYHEKVISHYESPRNVCLRSHAVFVSYLIATFLQVGSLNKNDFDVGTGLVGAPA
jgi:iron-sulfur cluster assembly enzyme ISCU, mitochondrial